MGVVLWLLRELYDFFMQTNVDKVVSYDLILNIIFNDLKTNKFKIFLCVVNIDVTSN